jgi:uncharacterized protein (TIGR03435 family)
MNPIRYVLLTAFASLAAFSQTPAAQPEFEVASVKASTQSAMQQLNLGVHIDGAMVTYTAATLRDYIRWAYNVKQNQISGPDWIASDRFDVVAKLPSGATRDQVPAMLQALLADRFKLKVHRDAKDFPVYALIVGKNGIKMTESAPDPVTDDNAPGKANVDVNVSMGPRGAAVSLGKGSSMSFDAQRIVAKKITMSYLADSLARFVDRPVVDMTNLKGNYDFTLDYNMDDLRAVILSSAPPGTPLPPKPEGDPGVSLMDSLQAAGLRLEPRKAPLEIIVVDHLEKTATAN